MDSNNNFLDRLKAKLFSQPTYSDLLKLCGHPNGFIRENAVQRLGTLGNPEALPFLIERANDWVPQLRKAAYDAILNLRKPGNAPAFIAALPALRHLEDCNRADHRGLVAQVHNFLTNDENRQLLMEHMSDADVKVASIVCKIVMQRNLLGPEELVTRCLSHPDVIVRSMASDSLRALDTPVFEAVITRALADKFMPVRREAFQQLLLRDRARGITAAKAYLFDRHASIREIAIKHLTLDDYDVARMYDDALPSATRVKVLVCILWGWTALKCTARADEVKKYLRHKSPAMRCSALQALAKLIGETAEPYLIAGLQDERRSVCTAASRLLIRLSISLSADQLASIVRAARTPHTVAACCNVASKGNKWERLQFVLDVYSDEPSAEIRQLLNVQLVGWDIDFNRSAAQPTNQHLSSVVASLRRCIHVLDKDQLELVRFTLRSYGAEV